MQFFESERVGSATKVDTPETGLEDAMSRQARAEHERQARIILGTAETEIASRFVAAGAERTGLSRCTSGR
jgi:hypothetical protein